MAKSSVNSGFPLRAAIFGLLTVVLFALAIWFYNNLQPVIGLSLLGAAFAVPMIWVVLAARDAENADTPLRGFIPRLTAMVVLGSAFLGYTMWSVNPQITAIEGGYIAFYLLAAFIAMRIFKGKPKRPTLTALSGGNLTRRERRRSR
jgi:hypothetical protein